jgi:hypothetical protein
MFRRSLDALGGMYREASVVVTFGSDAGPALATGRWEPQFERISTHHVTSTSDGDASDYSAQIDQRWLNVDDDCDFVIFADADTMVLRPFDDLIEGLSRQPAVAGVIAHYPFPQRPGERPDIKWRELTARFVGPPVDHSYAHTLVSPDAPNAIRLCPFYVNFGFVVIPRQLLSTVRSSYLDIRPQVSHQLATPYFGAQVALTLAIHRTGVPRRALDLKYNFPNDPKAEAMHPGSLSDLRVIHYLRTTHFDRQRIFGSRRAFDEFLGLQLQGSENVFQEHVRALTDAEYPF